MVLTCQDMGNNFLRVKTEEEEKKLVRMMEELKLEQSKDRTVRIQ